MQRIMLSRVNFLSDHYVSVMMCWRQVEIWTGGKILQTVLLLINRALKLNQFWPVANNTEAGRLFAYAADTGECKVLSNFDVLYVPTFRTDFVFFAAYTASEFTASECKSILRTFSGAVLAVPRDCFRLENCENDGITAKLRNTGDD